MRSNDNTQLTPQTVFDGRKLTFDFPGLEIGIAEYAEGPTGCTVFSFPNGVATATDVRGGSSVTTKTYEFNHAFCFAGGSVMGLEASAGVTAGIFAHDGYTFEQRFPLVSGAIVYDLGSRENTIYPDRALGRAAFEAAKPGEFLIGRRGAGRSVTVGGTFDDAWGEPSGQGAAFMQIGGVKIAVFVVVNASGCVYNRQG